MYNVHFVDLDKAINIKHSRVEQFGDLLRRECIHFYPTIVLNTLLVVPASGVIWSKRPFAALVMRPPVQWESTAPNHSYPSFPAYATRIGRYR